MATRALIGISGWRYAPWRGEFYPPGLPERDELEYAAARFPTIELNGSFYSLQRPEYYERWYDQVPPRLRVRRQRVALHHAHAAAARRRDGARELLRVRACWRSSTSSGRCSGSCRRHCSSTRRLEPFLELLPRTTKEAAKLARRHDERVAGRAYLRARRRSRAAPRARGAAPELRDTGAHRAAARARRRARRRRHGRPLAVPRGRDEPTSSTFACTAT